MIDTDTESEAEANKDEAITVKEHRAEDVGGEISEIDTEKEIDLKSSEERCDTVASPRDPVETKSRRNFNPEIFTMDMDEDSDKSLVKSSKDKGTENLENRNGLTVKAKIKVNKFKAPTASGCKKKDRKKTENKPNNDNKESNSVNKDEPGKTVTEAMCESKLEQMGVQSANDDECEDNILLENCFNKLEEEELLRCVEHKNSWKSKVDLLSSYTDKVNKDSDKNKQNKDCDSDVELDLPVEVPDINSQEKNENSDMTEDSEDDFDLTEKSMYDNDPVIEKIGEMEVVNVSAIPSQDSDSDPFDMMEE